MDYLPQVRAAVVKVIPEIMELVAVGAPVRANKENIYRHRPIRLSDVLRALDEKYQFSSRAMGIAANGGFYGYSEPGKLDAVWNLSIDSLDEQSPEILAFLHSILCKGDENV